MSARAPAADWARRLHAQPRAAVRAVAAVEIAWTAAFLATDAAEAADPAARAAALMAPPVLVLHGLALLSLTLWAARRAPAVLQLPEAAVLVGAAVLLGPWGGACAACAVWCVLLVPEAWVGSAEAALAPTPSLPPSPASSRSVDFETQSLAEVFRVGTLAARRNAVALMAANYRPAFAEALQMALRDEHNAIRVQAGMVLFQFEDDFAARLQRVQERIDADLVSHGFLLGDEYLELARLYDEYAWSGLVDPDRTRQAQAHALAAYREHLTRHPQDLEAIAAIGRLWVRSGMVQVAADWLGAHIQRGQMSSAVLMWHGEALYRAGRFYELQALFAAHGDRIGRHLPRDSVLHQALALWRERAATVGPSGMFAPLVGEPEVRDV